METSDTKIPPFDRLILPFGAFQSVQVVPMPELDDPDNGQFESPVFALDFVSPMRTHFLNEKCLLILDRNGLNRVHHLMHCLLRPELNRDILRVAFGDVPYSSLH